MSETDVSRAAASPLLSKPTAGVGELRLGDGDAVHDTSVTDIRDGIPVTDT